MVLLRHMLGDALRRLRLRQGRTLREVSAAARVSLGYLSEVERGQKEASSELLASICGALGAPLSQVLREVSDGFALAELQSEPVYAGGAAPVEPALNGAPRSPAPRPAGHAPTPAAGTATATKTRVTVPGAQRLPLGTQRRLEAVRTGRGIIPESEPVLDQGQLPVTAPPFESIRDITNMVPV
jgi:transcriptional regulator with XRE-family HTH domain